MFDIIARRAAVAAGMLVLIAGCKKERTSDNTAMSSDTSSSAMTSGAADTSMAMGSQSGQPGTLSDANIVALLDEANMADSAAGHYAATKATNADVKAFAKLMMGEHHALRVEGAKVAKEQNITLQLPTPDPFMPAVQAEQSALSSMTKGAAYDSTYIANEVGIHQAVIDWAGKNTPQNAALQTYMKNAGPTLVKHLNMAQDIQKKMSPAK